MTSARRLALTATGLLVLAMAVTGCGPTTSATVGSVSQNGVTVRFDWRGGAAATLAVTFTPDRPGFHLYSVDLPADGVDGLGRPTRVEVGGALVADGAPVVDRTTATLRPAGLDVALPVYPDGPVTLTVPAHLNHASGSGRGPVAWVSYAACSSSTCLPPVWHQRVDLTITGTM